jgi:hypothetical protein
VEWLCPTSELTAYIAGAVHRLPGRLRVPRSVFQRALRSSPFPLAPASPASRDKLRSRVCGGAGVSGECIRVFRS